jgi:oligopeptide transport system substrate-binding protein
MSVGRAETFDKAVDFASQTVQISLDDEPRNLNSIKAVDQISIFFLEHIMEGLLRQDERGRIVGGVAERWEINDKSAKFWLRHNARWSDGKPVTAQDFVFGWRSGVDPANASEYASIMYSVKNAEAINAGKLPVTALGIKAIDDYTLEVELEKPTGYFAYLMNFQIFYPVREDFYKAQNGRYFADVQNMVFNGPFKLTEWVHAASFRLEKNEAYWNRDQVHLNVINIPYVTNDNLARFNLFKDGKTALEDGMRGIGKEQVTSAVNNRMRIRAYSDGSIWYTELNHRKERVTSNKNLRKAMQAVLDSQEIVNKVIGIPGYIPGYSLFPVWLQGVHKKFRQEYPAQPPVLDVELAKSYMEQAKQELGMQTLPPIALLCDDKENAIREAVYFQSLFKRTLGLEVRVDIQTFKQRLEKMQYGEFDMILAGWGPDYNDPMTFADLFASWNDNNHGRYNNPEYDAALRQALGTSDPQVRMDAFGKAQQILIDDAAVLPQYERVVSYVQNTKLQGVAFKQTGAVMVLTYARVVE